MASDIIKEYLFKIAYQIDQNSSNKVKKEDKDAEKAAKERAKLIKKRLELVWEAVKKVSQATAEMVTQFASRMDSLYHASRRADASANNLQSLEYAAERVGIQGGRLTDILGGLNDALQLDPGKKGIIEGLGIDTAQDKATVLLQLMEKLFAKDDVVGSQFANMLLGMSQQEYLQLKRNRSEFYKYIEEKRQAQKDSGVDMDKAAEAGHRYANALKNIGDRMTTLKNVMSMHLLPIFEAWADVLVYGIDKFTVGIDWLFKKLDLFREAYGRFFEGIFTGNLKELKGAGKILADATGVSGAVDWAKGLLGGKSPETAPTKPDATPTAPAPAEPAKPATPMKKLSGRMSELRAAAEQKYGDLLNQVESRHALPSGMLLGVMGKESSYGQSLVGPVTRSGARAQGPMQFMPATAREYGINPMDFNQSIAAAGKKLAGLMKMFNGDAEKALAAYNWGEGNLMKAIKKNKEAGLPTDFASLKVPTETRDYVQKIGSGQLSQFKIENKNVFNVQGTDPKAVAANVAGMQDRVNADAVRYMGGVMR